MARVELSITTDYVKTWNAWCGIREWVQNARDAEVQFSAPMTIDWYNDTLRIENEGVTLPRESLLLGYSSKAGRSDLAGFWGEGYKIGTLALVRAGHAVKIRSGDEVWIPSIERSEKYAADVLVFNIKGGNKQENRIRVEIGGVTKAEWEHIKTLFLFVTKPSVSDVIETSYGDLMLGEKYRGKVYVKGIYVQSSSLNHGYNFNNVDLDRDRKMVASWDMAWRTSWIWKEAVGRRPDLIDEFLSMAEREEDDVRNIGGSGQDIDMKLSEAAAARFKARHGDNAVPVGTTAESMEVEHLGARGIVVSKSLASILKSSMGDANNIKESLKKSVKRTLSWSDISPNGKENLLWAIKTVENVCQDCKIENIDVVEFVDSIILGQYKENRTLISYKVLEDPGETLVTLVHEFAHAAGGDGEKAHIAVMERYYSAIFRDLRR
jgi:hypothetical protein